jgi:hypothetical protein
MFEAPEELLTCAQQILADPELQIVRVKNRFDLLYNAAISGGYRDVCFNLRIITSETKSLGLDAHVCELQLALLPIACIKVMLLLLQICRESPCDSALHLSLIFSLGSKIPNNICFMDSCATNHNLVLTRCPRDMKGIPNFETFVVNKACRGE